MSLLRTGLITGVVVLGGFGLAIVACHGGGGSPSAEQSTADAKLCDQSAAKALMLATLSRAPFTGMERRGSFETRVVVTVDPDGWRAIGLDGQRSLAATLDCALAGPSGQMEGVEFRQDRDGSDLFSATAQDLNAWRRQGLAVVASAAPSIVQGSDGPSAIPPAAEAALSDEDYQPLSDPEREKSARFAASIEAANTGRPVEAVLPRTRHDMRAERALTP